MRKISTLIFACILIISLAKGQEYNLVSNDEKSYSSANQQQQTIRPAIALFADGEIKRKNENGEVIRVKLNSDTFVQELNPANWSFKNLPAGVSIAKINRVSDTDVELVLSGNATKNYTSSISNFTVSVLAEELIGLTEGAISANSGVLFDASYWKLVWSDEFDYEGLPDASKWSFESMRPGTVNNELQNYVVDRLENARVENGVLTIECKKDNYNNYTYSSARLRTRQKGDWLYGKVVVSAKLPTGRGTWPAIWMLSTDNSYGGWPASGEIDIMEHVGYDPGRVHSTMHTGAYNHTLGTQKGGNIMVSDFATGFNEYIVDWKPEIIESYLNESKYFTFINEHKTFREWPFDKRFYLILNIAYGGSWGGAQGTDDAIFARPEGVKMEIDYVRVYKNIPELVINGPNEVLANQKDITFRIENIEGINYTWLPSDKYTLTTASDTNLIKIDWGCAPDTLKVELLVDGTELFTLSKVVNIKPFSIAGKAWIDENASGVVYSTQAAENTVYTWSASEGITLTSGQGTDSIYADFTQEGSIYLMAETDCGVNYDTFVVRFGDGQFPYPLGREPYPLPGRLVAGYFDVGGEGVAYHDTEAANRGNILRPDEGVDLEQKDGSYTIGWTQTGEWLEYTVDVAETANYGLKIRAGGESGGKLRFYQNGNIVLNEVNLPSTGSWDTFRDVNVNGVALEQGVSVLRVEFLQGGSNLGSMTFSRTTSTPFVPEGSEISIFPNPADGYIYFQPGNNIKEESVFDAKIFDIHGQILKNILISVSANQTVKIDVSSLPKGIYLLCLEGESEIFNTKFIKK
ncbi:MAG: family 16 glycosylhydrolase [Bacteroidales bacterium]|nr:family 16 glycosylhydrolase [Bacteroidales bacterium]